MYIKLNEELYKKIQEITFTDYNALGEFIPSESIEPMLEDLLVEIGRLEEKIEDIERDRDENYRPLSIAEQVGYREEDYYE